MMTRVTNLSGHRHRSAAQDSHSSEWPSNGKVGSKACGKPPQGDAAPNKIVQASLALAVNYRNNKHCCLLSDLHHPPAPSRLIRCSAPFQQLSDFRPPSRGATV